MQISLVSGVLLLCFSLTVAQNCPNGNKVNNRGVSDADIQVILDEHNKRRDLVAAGGVKGKDGTLPNASNMYKIVWDTGLAAAAQAHANYCNFSHFMPSPEKYGNNYGQNLNQVKNSGPIVGSNWPGALKAWYDNEVGLFTVNSRSPFTFVGGAGHFSQVVWAQTVKVGCGYTQYNYPQDSTYPQYALYTCDYSPTGNVYSPDGSVFVEMYTAGKPCSTCKCDAKYTNLCTNLSSSCEENGIRLISILCATLLYYTILYYKYDK